MRPRGARWMLADLVFNLSFLGVAAYAIRREAARPVPMAAALAVLSLGMALAGGVVFGRLFLPFRLIAWTLFVHVPILLYFVGASLRRLTPFALAGALLVVALDAFVIEPRTLQETRLEVRSPLLRREWTVALVADLQTDRVRRYEREALRRAMAAEPDLVLFAGDYLQLHDDAAWEAGIPTFQALIREAGFEGPQAPVAYAVQGNMEWRADWPRLFEGTSVAAVRDTTTFRREELAITALSLSDSFGDEPIAPVPGAFQIVFGHGPDFALEQPPGQLLLAGHTHGGQVRLPLIGPLITFSEVPRAWAAGLTRISPRQGLYVSRGVGLERGDAPRLRFGCLPELVILRLSPGEPSYKVVNQAG